MNFSKVSDEWNAGPNSYSNGAAYVDLDNDGDLDIVTNNINDHAFVLENKAAQKFKHNFLKIKLKGSGKNTGGIGAKVMLQSAGGKQQFRYVNPVRGFMSSVDPIIHFGLKDIAKVDFVEVHWPDGIKKRYNTIQINAINTLDSKDGTVIQDSKNKQDQTARFIEAYDAGINFVHREDYFTDFKREPIIHLKIQRRVRLWLLLM
ncbi:MAG: ASPIC/UnbV domain-containing protein [Saprospiraceae bacterium]|nr:ASPIC/UnbV domain-containing protein [Saprospiraceae bacterium]